MLSHNENVHNSPTLYYTGEGQSWHLWTIAPIRNDLQSYSV